MGADPHGLAAEHGVLLRHWAGVQARVSRQCDEQQRRCAALEAEVVRWRARWVLATTQLLWGLGWPGVGVTARRVLALDVPAHAASAAEVICQTGCAGHAHPWRDGQGHCRLTGGDCTRVPPERVRQSA